MRRKRIFLGTALLLAIFAPGIPQSQPILKLSIEDLKTGSRVVLSSSVPLIYSIKKSFCLLSLSIQSPLSFRIQQDAFKSEIIKTVGWTKSGNATVFTIEVLQEDFDIQPSLRKSPFELTIDVRPVAAKRERTESPAVPPGIGKTDSAAAVPAAARAVKAAPRKFKAIVLDPGHGGIESGAKGKFGSLEKDVTLAIALKLRDIIEKDMAYRVFLTRDMDMDVTLENRSALANNHQADLFISIHANGSLRKNARGSETFFLSLNATDEEARRLAYLENASGGFEEKIEPENQDDVKLILWDLAQSSYLKQSSRLAEIIQSGLNRLLRTENRGIKQAPFKVLTGVACPAVLVEAAFISNPEEEKLLQSDNFQNNVAQAIFRGLVEYLKLFP